MIKLELKPPQCEAVLDGHRCERDAEPAHDKHWYTVWTHPNQYGSFPSRSARWTERPIAHSDRIVALCSVT